MAGQTFMLVSGYDRHAHPKPRRYRNLTIDEIKALRSGDLVHVIADNGTVRVVKVNGAVRTWKRDPERVEVPMKYGMYEYFTLSAHQAVQLLVVEVTPDA